MHKEKEPSRQKKEFCPLSAVTSRVTRPKSFLLVLEDAMCPSLDNALVTFPLVVAASFTNDPRLKTPNNELIRITIKTPYNGLNDYN